MGGVNLDDVEAGADRRGRGGAEGLSDGGDTGAVELVGLRVIGGERDGAGGEDVGPAAASGAIDAFAAPRAPGAGFASGVGELDSGTRALGVEEGGDTGERRDVLVLPEAEILRADAAFGSDGGGFGEDEAAPPTARLPRWTRCQSLAKPSSQEYSHMGETTMRLERVREPMVIGGEEAGGILSWHVWDLDVEGGVEGAGDTAQG